MDQPNPLHDIPVPEIGEPQTKPLTDWELREVIDGTLSPSQGAAKSMAAELVFHRQSKK